MINNEEKNYGGMVDGLIDGLISKLGVDKELIKKINDVTADIMRHVETQQIGDELVITVHLNKIHLKMKK